MKVLFLDRDGTLIYEPPDGKVDSLEKFQVIPNVAESLKKLQDNGYLLLMVSNQPGLGTAKLPEEKFYPPHKELMGIFEKNGVKFKEIYLCPHNEGDGCHCMKPKTGLIDNFLKQNNVDLENSYFIGDRETDVQVAKKIGCNSVFYSSQSLPEADFSSNDWNQITQWILAGMKN